MTKSIRYLLVTHIPFARNTKGEPVVDGLWARDLIELARASGPIRVIAPELNPTNPLETWGPSSAVMSESSGVSFRGFPTMNSARSWTIARRIRRILREEVRQADLVHTSNFFEPYSCLSYAHDLAVKLGKKTLFVVAEDFEDMLSWEWVRLSTGFERWRRKRVVSSLDRRARKCAGSASLTLLHTPAALKRFRLSARQSIMIRHPAHEKSQVISETALTERLSSLSNRQPLRLTTACRHSMLKGLDLLIRAVGLLKDRGIEVQLNLYGRGAETARLQQLAATLGVADRVHLPGSLAPGEALDCALRQSDLFVMPHRTTDFGRAFFDAMAAGLPVLAFRTPASATTIYEGMDGFLTPLDDVQGLAERIAALDQDRPSLSLAARGARKRALDNTRAEWFRIRATWTNALFAEDLDAAA